MEPGYIIYLRESLGDYNAELKRSVKLLPGHEGILDEVYLSSDGYWKVRVKILDPPAQAYLIWTIEHFMKCWTKHKGDVSTPSPKMLDRWSRLNQDVLGALIGN